jgi:hypothetical protein
MPAQQTGLNLAIGAPIRKGANGTFRALESRELRALVVAYAITDLGESIGQADWSVGRVEAGQVLLPSDQPGRFSCTLQDAQWILGSVARLTRKDFVDIADEGHFPPAVAALAVEKMIARRDYLMKLFEVKTENLPFDSKVSLPPDLREGRLLRQDWPGYASRFSFGEEEAPLTDLGYVIAAEAESGALSDLVSLANSQIPALSIDSQTTTHIQELSNRLFDNYLASNGQEQRIPLEAWSKPLVGGGLVLSRDIVLGNYLGVENRVQLADTIGYVTQAGFVIGVDGLPTLISVNGVIQGAITRTYTHLKPLVSAKQQLKEPIRNLLVPWLKKRTADRLERLASIDAQRLDPDHVKKELETDLQDLKSALGKGESLIITTSISGSAGLGVGVGLNAIHTTASGQISKPEVKVRRLHIRRIDEQTIQVFQDNGDTGGLQFSAGVSLVNFPVFSLSLRSNPGEARMKYDSVNIGGDLDKNPELLDHTAALASLLKTGSTEALRGPTKRPRYEIRTDFRDSSRSVSFLQWHKRTLNTKETIQADRNDGGTARYIEVTEGSQSGRNLQALTTQGVNWLLNRLTAGKASVNFPASEDPGQSIGGKSKTRQATLQALADDHLSEPLVRIMYRWDGWSAPRKDAENILNEIRDRYEDDAIYPDQVLDQVKRIKFYGISVSLDIQERGLKAMAEMPETQLKALLDRASLAHSCDSDVGDQTACGAIDDYRSAWKRYQNLSKPENQAKLVDRGETLLKLASRAERFLPFDQLTALLGGEDRYYLHSTITGFRQGSEEGDSTISSSTLGKPRGTRRMGPVDELQAILGIDGGEFNGYWTREIL